MNVEFSKQGKQMELAFEEEGYTLLNPLRTEALEDQRVESVNYVIDPTTGRRARFFITAKGDPLEALGAAASRIAARCDELLGLLKKG